MAFLIKVLLSVGIDKLFLNMKKNIILLLVLMFAANVNAQREYRVVGQRGNKVEVSRCDDVYVGTPIVGQRCETADGVVFDRVVNEAQSCENVLVKEQKVVNYYHMTEEVENHFYISNTPTVREKHYQPGQTYGYTDNCGYKKYGSITTPTQEDWYFYFQLNSDFLTNTSEIGHLIEYARRNQYSQLYIDAYSDRDTGNKQYNMELSKRRADRIVGILLNEGVNPDRLNIRCHGSINQIYRTNNLNRCVTVKTSVR